MLNVRPFAIEADAARRAALLRHQAREGFRGPTNTPDAFDLVQGNLVVLPQADAAEFLLYCQRNPRPCPLLAVTGAGAYEVPSLGHGIDLRTDLPRYRVWRDGKLMDEPADVRALWRDDFVAFVIGCSFSFEWALLADGIPLRHVAQGRNVAMYRTDVATEPAGRFAGPLVVTMRPLTAADAIRAVQITSRFPAVHGAPVHLGDPSLLRDVARHHELVEHDVRATCGTLGGTDQRGRGGREPGQTGVRRRHAGQDEEARAHGSAG